MRWEIVVFLFIGYTPIALLVFAPACGLLARRRHRDSETWMLLGGALGPLALAWIAVLPERPRLNDAELQDGARQRTPARRIPTGAGRPPNRCQLCGMSFVPGHLCRPEVVEDRVQRRWTVRVGGQRIIGGGF